MNRDEDDLALTDPSEAMRLLRAQQAEAARRLNPDVRFYYWPWGVAWLVGFGLLFLRHGPDGRAFVDLPGWLPLTTLFVLLIVAAVINGLAGARAYGQVAGDSSRRGAWYGFAWFLGFAGMAVTIGATDNSLPDDVRGLLWAASSVGLTGALHLAGGAVWLDRQLFILGVWITVINIVGVIAGTGWHSLIVALAGGGGMLIAGTIAWLRSRSAP
jgi:hypothetical protein